MATSRSSSPRKRRRLARAKSEGAESDVTWKPLYMLCKRDGRYSIHEIAIRQDGVVEGTCFDDLPLVTDIFDGEERVFDVRCAGLNSKLYVAGCTIRRTYPTLSFDAKDRSLALGAFNIDPLQEKIHKIVSNCKGYVLIGARGKIYALVHPIRIDKHDRGLFDCFDPSTGEWKSLSPPPCLDCSSGYVVIEELSLILVCFVNNHGCQFYTFNLLANEWKPLPIWKSDTTHNSRVRVRVTRDPYSPKYDSMDEFWVGGALPIHGKAEFCNGVIYFCLLRTIATYKLIVDDLSSGTCYLEPPALHHLVSYNSEVIDFEDAPAFKKAPFGLPCYGLRWLTHLGSNFFCVVETALELDYEKISFTPVYITTFHFDLDAGHLPSILDSTVRLVDAKTDDAMVVFPISPNLPPGSYKPHSIPCPARLCQNFKEYVYSRIPTFCATFIRHMDEMFPYACMLFSKMKHEIESFENPLVRYFLQYMTRALDDGPYPNPLLLLDKELDDKLTIESPRPLDSAKSLDCNRSIFIPSLLGGDMCGLYHLQLYEGGGIAGNLISLVTLVKQKSRLAYFNVGCSVNLGKNVYFFSQEIPISTDVYYSVVDVENNSVLEKKTKLAAPKVFLTVFGSGSKIYALSAPLKPPDFIPKPAFECFDPALNLWKPLKDAPFHNGSVEAEIRGYVIVDDYVLISLDNDEFEFYSYSICEDEWLLVSKAQNWENAMFQALNGKAEYVDGKVYAYMGNGLVLEFLLKKSDDAFCIYPPIESRLDISSPLVSWDEEFSECMVHLGNNVFCAINTGESSESHTCQFASVTTFTVSKSGEARTLHSTICVIDPKSPSRADVLSCFSL